MRLPPHLAGHVTPYPGMIVSSQGPDARGA